MNPLAPRAKPKTGLLVTAPSLPFIDLNAQRQRIGARMDEAILKVIHSGQFIMGPAVFEAEKQLAAFCGAAHALTCSSGTDARAPALSDGQGRRPGDAVLCPPSPSRRPPR